MVEADFRDEYYTQHLAKTLSMIKKGSRVRLLLPQKDASKMQGYDLHRGTWCPTEYRGFGIISFEEIGIVLKIGPGNGAGVNPRWNIGSSDVFVKWSNDMSCWIDMQYLVVLSE